VGGLRAPGEDGQEKRRLQMTKNSDRKSSSAESKKVPRKPDKTRSDHEGSDQNKRHDPSKPASKRSAAKSARVPGKKGCPDQLAPQKKKPEKAEAVELRDDMLRIASLMDNEKSSGLQVGAIASKWIGNNRYNRVLNASTFAKEFAAITERQLKPRVVSRYVDAYKVSELLRRAEVPCEHLKLTHYEQLAASRCESDAELIELARRANAEQVSVRKIKALAASLHAELYRARRTVELVATETRVKCMDAIDLLTEQEDGSIECLDADWQWSKEIPTSTPGDLPSPTCPDDPVTHLIECLRLAQAKLAPEGLIILHHTATAFLDIRILEAIEKFGFQHAGQHIWQKTCGGFQAAKTPLMIGHEPAILLCRQGVNPKACCGSANSITPRIAVPTRANSGMTCVHPYQKPVALYETLISIATVNGLVVDLFAGSGSAGVAAMRLGCPYVGAEIVPEIAEYANQRIALAKGSNDEVVDSVNFFLASATEDQHEVITATLAKSGLRVVKIKKGGAA
jgi:DNA methylase